MKVFISVHHYPPNFTGGAELRAHRTALSLQQRGHSIQVFAIERVDDTSTPDLTWDDDYYEGIPIRRVRFNGSAIPDSFLFSYNNSWIEKHLIQFLSEVKPDLFHVFGGYLQSGSTINAATDLGIPTLLTLTDFWYICQQIQLVNTRDQICQDYLNPAACLQCYKEQKRRYRWPGKVFPDWMRSYWHTDLEGIERFRRRKQFLMETLNRVDAIIAPSRFIGETHIMAGVRPEKIFHMRQGRTFLNLTPALLEKQPSKTLRLAYMGQVTWIKGIHVLLEAIRLLPDLPLTLDIYGDMNKFPEYANGLRRAASSDSRVCFRELFDPSQVSSIYQSLDALVVPSLWYENSPNVILEAFAHRTPVLASDQGAMLELVTDRENGLVFRMGDAPSLAQAINRLATEPGLLNQLTTGIKPVKTIDQEIDELVTFYQDFIKQRNASHEPAFSSD